MTDTMGQLIAGILLIGVGALGGLIGYRLGRKRGRMESGRHLRVVDGGKEPEQPRPSRPPRPPVVH